MPSPLKHTQKLHLNSPGMAVRQGAAGPSKAWAMQAAPEGWEGRNAGPHWEGQQAVLCKAPYLLGNLRGRRELLLLPLDLLPVGPRPQPVVHQLDVLLASAYQPVGVSPLRRRSMRAGVHFGTF